MGIPRKFSHCWSPLPARSSSDVLKGLFLEMWLAPGTWDVLWGKKRKTSHSFLLQDLVLATKANTQIFRAAHKVSPCMKASSPWPFVGNGGDEFYHGLLYRVLLVSGFRVVLVSRVFRSVFAKAKPFVCEPGKRKHCQQPTSTVMCNVQIPGHTYLQSPSSNLRDPSIQHYLHWALKFVNVTYMGLFGSLGSGLNS